MNTDERPDLRRGSEPPYLLKDGTERIIDFAFEVLNQIAHGLPEKISRNALTVLFKRKGIAFDQERRFPILFPGVAGGECIPDLIAFGSLIVAPKAIGHITDFERVVL